jgi:hypothetical protein
MSVVSVVCFRQRSLHLDNHSSGGALPSAVYLGVISKPLS